MSCPIVWDSRSRDSPSLHLSIADIQQEVVAQGLVAEISGATLWRWLNANALRPWQHRSWIFPRDPDFAAKAGRILDLYERLWEGVPLLPTDFVISANEKDQPASSPSQATHSTWGFRPPDARRT